MPLSDEFPEGYHRIIINPKFSGNLTPILMWANQHVGPRDDNNHWSGDGWFVELEVITGFTVVLNIREEKMASIATLKFS